MIFLGYLLYGSDYVQYVNDNGNVNYNDYNNWNKSVRPALRWKTKQSRRNAEIRVPSSNEQITFPVKRQDKYKGTRYYDRK